MSLPLSPRYGGPGSACWRASGQSPVVLLRSVHIFKFHAVDKAQDRSPEFIGLLPHAAVRALIKYNLLRISDPFFENRHLLWGRLVIETRKDQGRIANLGKTSPDIPILGPAIVRRYSYILRLQECFRRKNARHRCRSYAIPRIRGLSGLI